MWLIHETTLRNLKHILDDGYIHPSSKTNIERNDVSLDHIFMSVLFDNDRIVGKGGKIDILLVFPVSLMKKYSPSHWSSVWNYGEVDETSIPYKKSLTPEQNVNAWEPFAMKPLQNEVVFQKSIPITEVAFIYMRKEFTSPFDIPKRIDTKQKLNKLLAT